MRRRRTRVREPVRRRAAVGLVLFVGVASACGHDEVLSALDIDSGVTDEPLQETEPTQRADSGVEPTGDGGAPLEDAAVRIDAGSQDSGIDASVGPVLVEPGDAAVESDAQVADSSVDAEPPSVEAPEGINGKVRVSPAIVLDTDLLLDTGAHNDLLNVFDESVDESQVLTNPARVGGYLGPQLEGLRAGAPPELRSTGGLSNAAAAGVGDAATPVGDVDGGADAGALDPWPQLGLVTGMDAVDYYRVDLKRGQAVTLFIHPAPLPSGTLAPVADLDLYLLDSVEKDIAEGGSWVEDSLGSADTEQVVAPVDGRYWVAVHRPDDATSGNGEIRAARYTLSVNVPLAPSVQERVSANRLSTGFASVGQAALVRRTSVSTEESAATAYRMEALPSSTSGDRRSTLRAIKRLRRQPGVENAEPVLRFQAQGLPQPDDPEFVRQWYHWPVDLLAGWVESERSERALGEGVVVAVIDTGIASAHPDFVNADGSSQLLDDGYDMISDEQSAADGDGRDPDPEDPGDRGAPGGGTFHGTHCAGNIAAATFNATGIVGVAPRAKILPVRVLGRGGGTLDDVIEGVLYAAGLPNATGAVPSRPADIINLSIAGPGRSEALAGAVAAARDAGAIVIAAAGNFSRNVEEYTPAAEPGVVAVSAVDPDIQLAWYSNYSLTANGIQLAAVGGDVRSDRDLDGNADSVYSMLFRDDGETLYGDIDGTSMAAAQVTGVVALMKAVYPALTPDEFDALIPEMVVDIGEPGPDGSFGQGLLNAPAAVAAALEASGLPPRVRPVVHLSPRGLDFGTLLDELPLELTNTGPGQLELLAHLSSDPWVSLEPGATGANIVRVERSALPVGEHYAVLSLETNVGTVAVMIRVEQEQEPASGDVGELTVVLLDVDAGTVVDMTTTDADAGYEFSFELPEPGRYRVLAGSDWAGLGVLGTAADVLATLPFGAPVVCVPADDAVAGCVDGDGLSAPLSLVHSSAQEIWPLSDD